MYPSTMSISMSHYCFVRWMSDAISFDVCRFRLVQDYWSHSLTRVLVIFLPVWEPLQGLCDAKKKSAREETGWVNSRCSELGTIQFIQGWTTEPTLLGTFTHIFYQKRYVFKSMMFLFPFWWDMRLVFWRILKNSGKLKPSSILETWV